MVDEALDKQLLDALYATFGQHTGYRVTHARGVLAHGAFIASKQAGDLSRAAHLQGQPIPVVLRFSNFSGIPSTPDGDPTASPRGLSLRFAVSDKEFTDIVAHSFDGFPVATPQDFLGFLRGIAADSATPRDPVPLAQFLASHPRADSYLQVVKPTPGSYVAERYYGVNTFCLLNARGDATAGRYRIDPMVDELYLDVGDASARSPDFLAHELVERLRHGQAGLRLMLQLPVPGDDLHDGSIGWPHTGAHARREIELGTIAVLSTAFGDAAQAGSTTPAFNPGNLIDGLAPSGDPMILARQRIYELAVQRRQRALQ